MKIELKNIPGALDKDKHIVVDGEIVGEVGRGWLRLGGEQWVITSSHLGLSSTGEKTLAEVKRRVARAANNLK